MHERIKTTARVKKVIASHLKRPFRFWSSGWAWVRFRALAAIANQRAVQATQMRKHTPLTVAEKYISPCVITS